MNTLLFCLWFLTVLAEIYFHAEYIENLNLFGVFLMGFIIVIFAPFMTIGTIGMQLLMMVIGDDMYDDQQ